MSHTKHIGMWFSPTSCVYHNYGKHFRKWTKEPKDISNRIIKPSCCNAPNASRTSEITRETGKKEQKKIILKVTTAKGVIAS